MRILVVDDEIHQLSRLEKAIQAACPNDAYTCFQNPSEAFLYAKDNPCDVALLDIHMGGMSGVALAKKLKDMKPDVNIIFCTGYSEYAMESLAASLSGYMMKPI